MAQYNLPAFRNALKLTKYPFKDTANLNITNQYFIPESLFEDASIYVDKNILKLMRIVKSGDTVQFFLGTQLSPDLAVGRLNIYEATEILEFYSGDSFVGIFVYDPLSTLIFSTWADGTYNILNGIELCLSCYVNLTSVGVTGFLLEDDTLSVGDVCFVGKDGVILQKEDNVITVHFVGDPLYVRRIQKDAYVTPRFVTSITFQVGPLKDEAPTKSITVYPDTNNNGLIQLEVFNPYSDGDVLRIYSLGSDIYMDIIGVG